MKVEFNLTRQAYESLLNALQADLKRERKEGSTYTTSIRVDNQIKERGYFQITVQESPGWDHETETYLPNGKINITIQSSDK